MIRHLVYVSLLSFTSFQMFGQNNQLFGRVLSADSSGIPYAHVRLEGTLRTCTTDSTGYFYIENFLPLQYEVSVNADRYVPKTVKIDASPNDKVELKIILKAKNCDPNRSNTCQLCKSSKYVIPIVYGLPTNKTLRRAKHGKVVLGGCMVTGCDDYWYCTKHKLRF